VQPTEIERIARTLLRNYALPFQNDALSPEQTDHCTVAFSDAISGVIVRVGVWCNAKVSPYHVRESLNRGLHVSE